MIRDFLEIETTLIPDLAAMLIKHDLTIGEFYQVLGCDPSTENVEPDRAIERLDAAMQISNKSAGE